MNRKQLALSALLAIASPATMAAVSDADFQALKNSIAVLTQKLDSMEKELAAEKAKAAAQPAPAPAVAEASVAAAKPAASSWVDTITLSGDLRVRYEEINQEGDEDRSRDRFRARAALVAKPQKDLQVGFGLSTSQNGDPVSQNQTIGDGGSNKDVYINLAYFNWTALEGLNVLGGKFKNNLYKPGNYSLLWDNDLDPEGFGVNYVNGMFFANLLGTWLDSDNYDNKAFVSGTQLGAAVPLSDAIKLTAGAGYYSFNTKGKATFYSSNGNPNFYGNSNANNLYVYDYHEIEGFADLGFKLFGLPSSLFADYVLNTDPSEDNTGWAAGLTIGAAKAKGTWEATYAYQKLENDAVFGLWTDSDFGGGGTDNEGSVFRGAYALSDKTNLAFTYFLNQIDEDIDDKHDYDRMQLDVNFKY